MWERREGGDCVGERTNVFEGIWEERNIDDIDGTDGELAVGLSGLDRCSTSLEI